MTETQKGILAVIGACTIWGLAPILYKVLAHIPASEILAHRGLWSLVFFGGLLAMQGRLTTVAGTLSNPRRAGVILLASLLISCNWFLFIYANQIDRLTEAGLGYYIHPLLAVLIGRFWFGEILKPAQWIAIAVAALAVLILTAGLGNVPWIALALAASFSLYGVIKKQMQVGPIVSVTCEVVMFLPVVLILLARAHMGGQGAFGTNLHDTALLIATGPITALPLILFSMAARRISMSSVGVLLYLNPTLQVFLALIVFGEPFTATHGIVLPLIWGAIILYSVSAWRQDRASRSAAIAASGVSTQSMNPASDRSANP